MELFYHLLVNPNSGGGQGRIAGEQVIQYLKAAKLPYSARFTTHPDHERRLIQEMAVHDLKTFDEKMPPDEVYPLLVVIGGDGTIHQVVNELYRLNKQIPIAYIPAGSGNDFARGLGLTCDPIAIMKQIIATKEPRECSIIHYIEEIYQEEGLALNNIGIGLDAAIVYETNHSKIKGLLQKFNLHSFSYLSSVIRTLMKQRPFPILVEANGKQYSYPKTYLCTTSNHPYFGGGVPIAPNASVHNEKVDLVVIEKPSWLLVPWIAFHIFRRTHLNKKFCHYFQANKIKIVSTIAEHGQADGEEMGERSFDITFTTQKQLFWY